MAIALLVTGLVCSFVGGVLILVLVARDQPLLMLAGILLGPLLIILAIAKVSEAKAPLILLLIGNLLCISGAWLQTRMLESPAGAYAMGVDVGRSHGGKVCRGAMLNKYGTCLRDTCDEQSRAFLFGCLDSGARKESVCAELPALGGKALTAWAQGRCEDAGEDPWGPCLDAFRGFATWCAGDRT